MDVFRTESTSLCATSFFLCVRLSFLAMLVLITCRGIRGQGRAGCYALPAVLAIAVALFAQELSVIHVPGIWFPFGTGVSRTQYAYAVFDIALAGLLWHRLRGYARRSNEAAGPVQSAKQPAEVPVPS